MYNKIRKSNRRDEFRRVMKELRGLGFEVKEVAPFTYRIADWIDVCPATKTFYDLKTKERGEIKGLKMSSFIKKRLGIINYNE